MSDEHIQLGEMLVAGRPPAKLLKALAVITSTLHQTFDRCDEFIPGISKESCVLCSLIVREFLLRVGFVDVAAVPSCVVMWAVEKGRTLHSVGIGHPTDDRRVPGKWVGHMVVTVDGYLIDTTLFQAIRPAWPDLSPMIALPVNPEAPLTLVPGCADGRMLPYLAGLETEDTERDYLFTLAWLARPGLNTWRRGPDGRNRERRLPIVHALIDRFGKWT